MKLILTGATGMVGEGVLLTALADARVEKVLVVGRRPCGRTHPKLEEALLADFSEPSSITARLGGFDACLYCAGISSAGMTEADYTKVTLEAPLRFAEALVKASPQASFHHVSGAHTDATEQGRVMWARIKGRAENALSQLPFRAVVHYRPALMRPRPGQRNVRPLYRVVSWAAPVLKVLFPGRVSTLEQVGNAMLRCALEGAPKPVLEVEDINALAASPT